MVVLVRYGELALKSRFVRRQLQDMLVTNLQEMFASEGVPCLVRSERGRLFVDADDEETAVRLLARVFGIVSVSPAKETSSSLAAITEEAVALARSVLTSRASFAIRPRRTGQHPYRSRDLAIHLGKAVQDAIPGATVDLDAPDVALHVEVRGARAYVFHEVVPGPGGLPLGSQGEVLAPVEDDRGMVAAWLMMRRGCGARVAGAGMPTEALRAWNPRLETLAARPWEDLVALAAKERLPVVDPSRSLDDLQAAADVFVLRPLVGLSDGEFEDLARAIRRP